MAVKNTQKTPKQTKNPVLQLLVTEDILQGKKNKLLT